VQAEEKFKQPTASSIRAMETDMQLALFADDKPLVFADQEYFSYVAALKARDDADAKSETLQLRRKNLAKKVIENYERENPDKPKRAIVMQSEIDALNAILTPSKIKTSGYDKILESILKNDYVLFNTNIKKDNNNDINNIKKDNNNDINPKYEFRKQSY
jgi:hypothetical protein